MNLYLWRVKKVRNGKLMNEKNFTAWKVPKYGVFSGPYFAAFGLSTDIYVNLCTQSGKCGNAGKYRPE